MLAAIIMHVIRYSVGNPRDGESGLLRMLKIKIRDIYQTNQ